MKRAKKGTQRMIDGYTMTVYAVRYSTCTPEGVEDETFFANKDHAIRYLKGLNEKYQLTHIDDEYYTDIYIDDDGKTHEGITGLWLQEITVILEAPKDE